MNPQEAAYWQQMQQLNQQQASGSSANHMDKISALLEASVSQPRITRASISRSNSGQLSQQRPDQFTQQREDQVDLADQKLVSRQTLRNLLSTVERKQVFDPDVEEFLMDVANNFVKSVTLFATRLANHRVKYPFVGEGESEEEEYPGLTLSDVSLAVERLHGIKIPGFGIREDVVPVRDDSARAVALHKQHVARTNHALSLKKARVMIRRR